MSRKATYPTPWLDCRYPFDVRARHAATEAAALGALPSDPLRLVDIGCGNGANLRYFWKRLEQDQYWTLIDSDPQLLEAALSWMETAGLAAGYRLQSQGPNLLKISRKQQVIEVRTLKGSLLDLPQLVSLPDTDLVLANAVFDLFSAAQTRELLTQICQATALFLSLNYTGMAFSPEHPLDATVIGWYEAHMQRPQAFGRGMGADGPAIIEAWLQKQGGPCAFGTSSWEVLPRDQKMLTYLLGFMAEAIPELGLTAEETDHLANWLATRRDQLAAGELGCSVWHRDQWAGRLSQ